MRANINWSKNLTFSGMTISEQEIRMDAAEDIGGNNSGARPTYMNWLDAQELILY